MKPSGTTALHTLLGGLVLAAVITVSPPDQQGSPCRTAADTVTAFIYATKQMLASAKSDTSNVSIVTDSTVCQAAVNSYNADVDSTQRVSSAYLARAGWKYVLYVPALPAPASGGDITYMLDSTFTILVRMEGIR